MPIRLRLSRVSIIIILIITAIPGGLRDPRTIYWRLIWRFSDGFANVLLFFPLGLFRQPTSSLRSVTAFGAGLSTLVEIAQLFFVRRNSQPSDVICNTLGALCGGLAGRLLGVRSDEIKLGKTFGIAAILGASIWTTAYFLFGGNLAPAVGRGSVAIVGFLWSLGLTGIVQPGGRYSRLMTGLIGGAIGAAVLLPVSHISPVSTFALGLVFGAGGVYCTTSDDDRPHHPHRPQARADATDLRSV